MTGFCHTYALVAGSLGRDFDCSLWSVLWHIAWDIVLWLCCHILPLCCWTFASVRWGFRTLFVAACYSWIECVLAVVCSRVGECLGLEQHRFAYSFGISCVCHWLAHGYVCIWDCLEPYLRYGLVALFWCLDCHRTRSLSTVWCEWHSSLLRGWQVICWQASCVFGLRWGFRIHTLCIVCSFLSISSLCAHGFRDVAWCCPCSWYKWADWYAYSWDYSC